MHLTYFIISISISYFLVAPSPPTGPLEAFDVDRNAISIKWKPPADDGGSPLMGYIVEKREASRTIWSRVDNVDAKTTQLRCKNLIEKTEYFFRVIAINAIGASQPLQADEATLARSRFSEYYLIMKMILKYFFFYNLIHVKVNLTNN